MALVFIPTRLQVLTAGCKQVSIPGATVRQVIDGLEAEFPGIKAKLYDAERDSLARGMAVTVEGVTGELGLLEKVGQESEVHFLPAIAGGSGPAARPIQLADDGTIPNNPLPLLLYEGALSSSSGDLAGGFERLFADNGWKHSWRNGIYAFRHYHSTAHEVLGIAAGTARVEFGGPQGVEVDVSTGDAVLIPAGVSHYNLGASGDLLVIGAYPDGPDWDLCRDTMRERAAVLANIAAVPAPSSDPVLGGEGGIAQLWD